MHCLDFLIEDLVKIPALESVVYSSRELSVLVKKNKYIAHAFYSVREGNKTQGLKIFPGTRFAYAPLTLERLDDNRRTFSDVLFSPYWADVCKKLGPGTKQKLLAMIADLSLWDRFSSVLSLLAPISRVIHHL